MPETASTPNPDPTAIDWAEQRYDDMLHAELERLRTALAQIASTRTPCERCGEVHPMRCSNPDHQPHSYQSVDQTCGAVTWADPDDGHAYSRLHPATLARQVLGLDSGHAETPPKSDENGRGES